MQAQPQAEGAERHRELARRRQADAHGREERERLRQRESVAGIAPVRVGIAVRVIVDNGPRRCRGLPRFTRGAPVTAEWVVSALEALLPTERKDRIADGGQHFTAEVMKKLAKERGFLRVPLAKHRAQSNGRAERFIETLKAWLANKEWRTAEDLANRLREFLHDDNDRPHQAPGPGSGRAVSQRVCCQDGCYMTSSGPQQKRCVAGDEWCIIRLCDLPRGWRAGLLINVERRTARWHLVDMLIASRAWI
ncbi:MAG: transposase [Chloroflexi bacterium]|nr:transposase [Chloroflexota bacterium]